jgi:hypothetical protein
MVQLHPRSLDNDWSVSVAAGRVLGKDEDRVQFPDGPLRNKWGVGPTGRRLVCTQEIGVRLPDAPLDKRAHSPTGRRQLGRLALSFGNAAGSIPGGSTVTEGSRIRFAGPVC